MSAPKITVIIPTRERCDVLESSLRTVTSQDYENLEIIVSDNCSTDDTEGVVRRANDPRIRYINTGKRVSMSHNWEFALSHVSEGWTSFIGDDDGLMPQSIRTVAEVIETSGVEAIRSTCCTYHWPAIVGNENGQLIVPMGSRIETREASSWLGRVMRGVTKYPQLPVIYDGGFISLAALNKVKRKTGAFFSSCIPDLYSAVAIASAIDRYVFLHEPMAVSGVSRHSTGNSQFSREKSKNAIPAKTFSSEGNIPFHSAMTLHEDGSLPISYQAMVYEAYLQSSQLRASNDFSHRQQLEVILATAEHHRESIEKWARLFAAQHDIDFESTKRSAAFKRAYLQPLSTVRKMINSLNTTFADNLPIRNVHEACIAAGTIRARPGKLGTVRFLSTELAGRLKGLA